MIRAKDLESIAIFSSLEEAERHELALRAGDVHLDSGDYLHREGEVAHFHILLEGQLSLHKNFNGRYQEVTKYGKYYPGDFMGEIPILLASRTFAVLRADLKCRVARFDPQIFHRLIREHAECRKAIMAALTERLMRLALFFSQVVSTRALVIGSQHDQGCRDIRHFLTMSRIPFEWVDADQQTELIPAEMPKSTTGCAVLVDGARWVSDPPTVRSVAEALGCRTCPHKTEYDLIVIGGGPAGLAASVYGASEGLSVLMIERNAAGGQAGTSTNIENYLGFPDGISGDDLGERALRQAGRFGAEIIVTREVTGIERLPDGRYCCMLEEGEQYRSNSVILATGVTWRPFEAAGIDRLLGRGVLYGAGKTEVSTIVGKDVFIVGGGNSAGQAAVYFATYANSVTVLVRGAGLKNTMSHYLIDKIARRPNIRVEPFTRVLATDGEDHLESITTVKMRKGEPDEAQCTRKADALFILIGASANTSWLPRELQRDKDGFVYTGRDIADLSAWKGDRPPYLLETNLPGFFCAGDVRHASIKRVSSGVGEGSMAIAFVHQYLALQQESQAAGRTAH